MSRPVRVTHEQVEAACKTLGRAFADDAIIRWPLRPDVTPSNVAASFRGLVEGHVGLQTLYQVEACSGVAAWMSPETLSAFDRITEESTGSVIGQTFDDGARYREFWSWNESHIPTEPMWFLDFVGVDPAHQGKALGSALVRHGLAAAKDDGLPAFLETGAPGNVPLYEHLGFRVVDEGDPPNGGPHVWYMRADP